MNDPAPVASENKLAVVSLQFPWPTALEDEIEKSSFALYPNPAFDQVSLAFESKSAGEIEINVSNLIGQSLIRNSMEIQRGANTLNIDVSTLGKGIYLVSLGSGEGRITQKLVIE